MSDKNYLSKLPDWSPETACQLAAQESLTFSEAHIEVLEAARQFFDQYGFSPSMRPLCHAVADHLSIEKGRSIYLLQLFPGSPAKFIAYYAGLPKPKNCI